MIRGLVPKERLLEWQVGDGWESLCAFLDKPVPKMDFPHANAQGKGWKEREEAATKKWVYAAVRNASILTTVLIGTGAVAYTKWCT